MNFSFSSSLFTNRNKIFPILIVIISAWYVFVILTFYLSRRLLWSDEQFILQSILTLDGGQFFNQELYNKQVFPRFYLYLIQSFAGMFHFDLLALRFLPCAAMMISFFLWLKIAQKTFKDQITWLIFILSWPASSALVYYANELKQYSMDVLAASLFVFFLTRFEGLEKNFKITRILLLILPSLVLLSHAAYFFILLPLWNLFMAALKSRRRCFLSGYIASCAVFISFSYFFDLSVQPLKFYQQLDKDLFIIFTSPAEFFESVTSGISNLFSRWFIEEPRWIRRAGRFFVFFGLIELFRGSWRQIKTGQNNRYIIDSVHKIAFIVLLELFILGCCKLYPFIVPRGVLFFCPDVLYLTAQGINMLQGIHLQLFKTIRILYFCFLVK